MLEQQETWTRASRRLELGESCPLCKTVDHRLLRAHDYWIRTCPSCLHRWAEIGPSKGHVDRVYDDSYFCGGGAGYPDYISHGPLLFKRGRRYGLLLSKHIKPGSVLDVGTAAGFILQGLLDTGWTGAGVEPNESMASLACNNLGLRVFRTPFEDVPTSERFDLVSMIQVLPHFVDVKTALDQANRLTKPDGCWLIETWDCRSLTARLWGKHWHEYNPLSVLHWFSRSTVRRIAEEYGFEEIATGRPLKRISGAHIKSIVHHKTQDPPVLRPFRYIAKLVPDHLTLPYPAEDLFWVLFRKKAWITEEDLLLSFTVVFTDRKQTSFPRQWKVNGKGTLNDGKT